MQLKYLNKLREFPIACAVSVVVIAISILFGALTAPADLLEVVPGEWVCDGANVLSEETETAAQTGNTELDQAHTAYLAVATVDHLRGWKADEYAQQLFDKWGLYGNDFLLLMDVKGQENYLYQGGNYTNFDYTTCLNERVNPFVQEQDYDGAVIALFDGIEEFLSADGGIYSAAGGGAAEEPAGEEPESGGDSSAAGSGENAPAETPATRRGLGVLFVILRIVLVLIVLFAIFEAIDRSRYRRWYNEYGYMDVPPRPFAPIFFWHRPGGGWYRRMYRPGPGPGGPGPGPGPRGPGGPGGPGGPRPGDRPRYGGPGPGNGPRPSGGARPGNGPRPSGGPRPGNGSRPSGGSRPVQSANRAKPSSPRPGASRPSGMSRPSGGRPSGGPRPGGRR